MRESVGAHGSEQSDAVGGIGDVEVDARHVAIIGGSFVRLEKEVATVVIPARWAAGIVGKHHVQVLVGLSLRRLNRLWRKIVEQTECRDHAGRIFQQVATDGDALQNESTGDDRVGMSGARVCVGYRRSDRPNPALAEGKGGGKNEAERDLNVSIL